MIPTASVGRVLCVASIVVTAMVAVDLRGALPGAATLAFIVLAPGLALSLHMGPMAGEARLLISAVGSAAVGAVMSVALLYTGLWSGRLGFFCIAAVTQAAAVAAIRRDRTPSQAVADRRRRLSVTSRPTRTDRARPAEPRRRDTVILAVVGFAAALLLFASAALPVLSDRAPDNASGPTLVPTTTVGSPPPTSSAPQLRSPSLPPQPTTTVDVATTPPSTTASPSTSPATPPASTASTAPPEDVAESHGGHLAPEAATATGAAGGSVGSRTDRHVGVSAGGVRCRRAGTTGGRPAALEDGRSRRCTRPLGDRGDPRDIGAALVIDDRPTVDARVLGQLQGGVGRARPQPRPRRRDRARHPQRLGVGIHALPRREHSPDRRHRCRIAGDYAAARPADELDP